MVFFFRGFLGRWDLFSVELNLYSLFRYVIHLVGKDYPRPSCAPLRGGTEVPFLPSKTIGVSQARLPEDRPTDWLIFEIFPKKWGLWFDGVPSA